MAESGDPFLQVQADVRSLLTTTRHLFSSFLRIRTLNPNPASPELVQARSELVSNLETLKGDLEDLLASIAAVENDPYTFGLDTAEVARRRDFVHDVSAEVESMGREIRSSGAGSQLPDPRGFEVDADPFGRDDAYTEFEMQQQETMMREQDAQLDDLTGTVGRLRGQAADMGRELEEQVGILEEVENVADRVGGKLQGGLKRVGEMVRRNEDKYSSCCIAVLIVVLMIILLLLIIL